MNELRTAFESCITAPPIEASVDRYPEKIEVPWAGQYKTYTVQLAWDAWWAASEHAKRHMANRN